MIISAEYHDVSEYFNQRAAGIQLIASLFHGHMAPTSLLYSGVNIDTITSLFQPRG